MVMNPDQHKQKKVEWECTNINIFLFHLMLSMPSNKFIRGHFSSFFSQKIGETGFDISCK